MRQLDKQIEIKKQRVIKFCLNIQMCRHIGEEGIQLHAF